jgi:subtilisin family serine protease
MKCPQAWRYTNGSQDIIIQIIDGGTDYSHPDLVHNIWQNLGEDADGDGHTIEWCPVSPYVSRWVLDPGDNNNQDDDGNYHYDDLVGFNFYYDPWDPNGWDPGTNAPSWGDHGTKTAGTAAAVTDNWLSEEEAYEVCNQDTGTVAGTSWFSKIMIAKISGLDISAIRAIHYGRNNGAKIMSMSWGSTYDWPNLHAVLDAAYEEGILLIAAAGNDSNQVRHYPAAYENVVAVAATDINDRKKDYSCYGTWVDICAPTDNLTTAAGLGHTRYCYYTLGGTSCSAPFVAGVAALVWTCNRNATNAEVRDALENTADNIDGLNPGYAGLLGSGRVNALRAVQVFRPVPPPPGDANSDMVVTGADLVCLLSYIYRNLAPPDPWCVGDVTDDGIIDAADVTYLLNYLFQGGPPPLDGCD